MVSHLIDAQDGGGWAVRGILGLVLLTSAAIGLTPSTADATETDTFKVEPSPLRVAGEVRRSFVYNLDPGMQAVDSIRITNKTAQERRFNVYAADAAKEAASGAVKVEARSQVADGVGSWIEVGQVAVTLPPRASKLVEFTITKPGTEQPEGFGAIVVEEVKESSSEAGIDVAYRLAVTVRVTGAEERLHVGEPSLEMPLALVPQPGLARVELRNDTLRSLSTVTDFSVEGLTGIEWALEPVQVDLRPGETEVVEASWTTPPRWGGLFQVRAATTWEAGTIVSTGSRGVHPPLWMLAIVIIGVGIRGLREMWSRRKERRSRHAPPAPAAPDPDALRRRLIEASLWLRAAGQDARRELRQTTAAEARAVAAEARRTKDALDIENAARSLAAFAEGLDDGDGSTKKAAHDFDEWFREHRDDPRVRELAGT